MSTQEDKPTQPICIVRFGLGSLLLGFVVFGSAMVAFGIPLGIGITVLVVFSGALGQSEGPIVTKARLLLRFSLLVLVPSGVLISCFAPRVRVAREHRYQQQCIENLGKIMAALEAYRRDNGALPPTVVRQPDGSPMHSWRVLILPHLGYEELANRYDMGQPWNSDANLRLVPLRPREYDCLSNLAVNAKWDSCATSYAAIIGPQSAWALSDVIDRGSYDEALDDKIFVVEIAKQAGILWTEPRDLASEDAIGNLGKSDELSIHSPHRRMGRSVGHAGFADGTVRILPQVLQNADVEQLLRTDLDTPTAIDNLCPPVEEETKLAPCYTAMVLFLLSAIALHWNAMWTR